ncbi:MAG TPA: 2-oxoacid:acceptor oxidoreductase subunit alpha [Bacteroidales bacterium]|nr:2-oxoacid:acceptor oxidoreductase subunit alpha [Bacteroidales bacterium]
MSNNIKRIELDNVVVKFVGDSGDGMQLTGTIFSDSAVKEGNDIATFPDYPAEIRAPHNTVAGVSGFQVHVGQKKIHTIGDLCDVLVAMNPASLRANLKWAKPGGTIIVDVDTFEAKAFDKAGYKSNPLEDGSLNSYNVVLAPITSMTKKAFEDITDGFKIAEKSRNMFALGITLYIFSRDTKHALALVEQKFAKKPAIASANKLAVQAGYNYAETIEALHSTYYIPPAKIEKGKYRIITGNIATAWGLLAASERSGRPIFLGSYPITPATDIMVELAKHKSLGAKIFQAEDEIAGICSSIGASFTGSLAITTTSGPGFSLKSEAMGLAVMTELPLVIVDVQRAGPSTGMPTKSEQSDLYQALFGRNGECPLVVMAASSPADCFYAAYEAAKLAMEHMTPVVLLTDGYIGNGSELFRIPKVADLNEIHPPIAKPNEPDYKPYRRNPETLVRKWALPGTEGLRHRIGGLEKENIVGTVTTDPLNHETMVNYREAKIQKIADFIDPLTVTGAPEGDLLVVSWGGTEGPVLTAVKEVQGEGKSVSHAHFKHIMPLPKNTAEVFKKFKKILVCELNSGQFVNYLRMTHSGFIYQQYNKVQGLPFMVSELVNKFNKTLEE